MTTNNKNFRVKNGLDVGGNTVITGDANVTGKLSITASAGDEGGEIFLSNAATNTTITSGVTIDVYQNRLRFFEQGGDARGYYIDITGGGSGVSTNLVGGGSASNSFATVSANGTSVVADSSTDTLTITPGDGISITGNATSDTIIFTPNIAGASANGIVTTGTQTFAGEKTFSNTITASANIVANTGFVSADTFRLDTTYTGGSAVVGEFSWDPDFETARLLLDGATLQIGQEHLVRVKNASGSVAIPDRTLVMFAGATGDTVTVSPANSSNIATNPSDRIVGITTEEIAADGFGFVTQFGFVNQVNTAAWTVGTLLYSDPATPGGFVTSRPAAPSWSMPIAAVTRQHATTGRIFVRALPGQELEEIDNVQITSVANNEVLAYDSTSGTWINQTAEEAGVANLSGATFTGNVVGTNISLSGNVNATTVNATTFIGSGASLTSIPNSATTANSANGASTIVARDATGNFTINTITANGNVSAANFTNGGIAQLNVISTAYPMLLSAADGITLVGPVTANVVANGTTTSAASGIGYMGIPRSAAATTGSYTLTAADAGEHIYTTTTRTITIPGNTTGTGPVAFPIGTTIVFINDTGVTLTIQMQATATDTCILSGVGTSITGGSATPRTLAAFGMATLVKVTSTTWYISGNGLT